MSKYMRQGEGGCVPPPIKEEWYLEYNVDLTFSQP